MLESRMNCLNITEGNNTHDIVLNRLIELWNTQPKESDSLFKHIASLLAEYDNPNPVVSFSFGQYVLYMSKNGKRVKVARSRHKNIIRAKLHSMGFSCDI